MFNNAIQDFDRQYNTPVLGIDEAGRGPLCGPVVSACVWWPNLPDNDLGITDSKKLSPSKRQDIFNHLTHLHANNQIFFDIGIASPEEIDDINILEATKLSMYRAFQNCKKPDLPFQTLIDGQNTISSITNAHAIIKGDQRSLSIATASIIAKVTRDQMMEQIHILYPHYHLDKHKGYGTKLHKEQIKKFGLCPYHRKTFKI